MEAFLEMAQGEVPEGDLADQAEEVPWKGKMGLTLTHSSM